MTLTLTIGQVKEAIADYVNGSKMLNNIVIEPEHISIKMTSQGEYDERVDMFDGVTIDLAAAKAKK